MTTKTTLTRRMILAGGAAAVLAGAAVGAVPSAAVAADGPVLQNQIPVNKAPLLKDRLGAVAKPGQGQSFIQESGPTWVQYHPHKPSLQDRVLPSVQQQYNKFQPR